MDVLSKLEAIGKVIQGELGKVIAGAVGIFICWLILNKVKRKGLRIASLIITLCITAIAMFYFETLNRCAESYREAMRCEEKKDIDMAIVWYNTVISFYTPGSKLVKKAINRLLEIGKESEKRRDWRRAVDAYEAIWRGIHGVRSFYTPYAELLPYLKEKIDFTRKKLWEKE